MQRSTTTERRRPIDFVPFGLLAVSLIARVLNDHDTRVALIVVRFAALAGGYGMVIWLQGRRTELDRLVFYKATTVAFCFMMASALVYGMLIELDVVSSFSLQDGAQFGFIAWVLSLSYFRSQAS